MAERDRRALVVYDEGCGFCTCAMAALLVWDRRRLLEPAGFARAVALGVLDPDARAEWSRSFHLVDAGGRRSGGRALAPLLVRLPGGGPAGRLAARFPGAAERLYRAIAGRRRPLGRLLPARVRVRCARAVAGRTPGG